MRRKHFGRSSTIPRMYAIRWARPNDRGSFIVTNGDYTLVPLNRKGVPGLLRLLHDATVVEPPEAKSRLEEISRRLRV